MKENKILDKNLGPLSLLDYTFFFFKSNIKLIYKYTTQYVIAFIVVIILFYYLFFIENIAYSDYLFVFIFPFLMFFRAATICNLYKKLWSRVVLNFGNVETYQVNNDRINIFSGIALYTFTVSLFIIIFFYIMVELKYIIAFMSIFLLAFLILLQPSFLCSICLDSPQNIIKKWWHQHKRYKSRGIITYLCELVWWYGGIVLWLNIILVLYLLKELMSMFFASPNVYLQFLFDIENPFFIIISIGLAWILWEPIRVIYPLVFYINHRGDKENWEIKMNLSQYVEKKKTQSNTSNYFANYFFVFFVFLYIVSVSSQSFAEEKSDNNKSAQTVEKNINYTQEDKQIKQIAENILNQPEFSKDRPRISSNAYLTDLLKNFWDFVSNYIKKLFPDNEPKELLDLQKLNKKHIIIFLLVFSLLSAVIVGFVIYYFKRISKKNKRKILVDKINFFEIPDFFECLKKADDFYNKGMLEESLKWLFWALISYADKKDIMRYVPSKTNQELVMYNLLIEQYNKLINKVVEKTDPVLYGEYLVNQQYLKDYKNDVEQIIKQSD